MPRFPRFIVVLGVMFVLLAAGRFVYLFGSIGTDSGLVFDTILIMIPGVAFLYVGIWLPGSDIEPRHHRYIIVWFLGGIGVMFGFLVLRELHPDVNADWTVGTQAIAFMIGSVGGLLIGIQKTRTISRTEQLEQQNHELTRRKRELTNQNRRLENVTTVISHDLRSPLSATIGWIELAKADPNANHLSKATTALRRMGDIIDNTLALTHHGETVVATESFLFSELAIECWDIAGASTAELTVVDDGLVTGDRDRVKHIFENIFRNAIEHAGRSVTVRTGILESDGFYIEDDGPGIPAASRTAIFDSGYTTIQRGTGFGLAIVTEIVDAHDWAIRLVDSDLGGARFEITGVSVTPTQHVDVSAVSDRQRAV
jgi:signal transduction histidine kinase